MKKPTILPGLAAASLAALAALTVSPPSARGAADGAGDKIFPYEIRQTVLPNGLRVISVPYDSPGIIAYYTVVRTGSRNEVEKGLSGFAHFFEHMMFRGTDRYDEKAYNNALKGLGADFNASTDDDWTRYYFTLPSTALEKIIDLETDRFQNLKYAEPEFQKEARAVLGEYNKSASSPFLILDEKMRDLAFTDHTYKHTTIGFLDDVKAMPDRYQYSLEFFKRWYRPDNCAVIVAGDVDHAKLTDLLAKHTANWKPGVAKIEVPVEPAQKEERTAELSWPTPTLPILYEGYHIPATDPKNPDTPALIALSAALFSETSPLYKELVLEKQTVVNLIGESQVRRDASLFTIVAMPRDPNDLPTVQAKIHDALAKAASVPIEADRLKAIQSRLRYGFASSLDSPKAVAEQLADMYAITGQVSDVNDLYAGFAKLTPADLTRVAGKYFAATNRTVVTLTTAGTSVPKAKPAPQAVQTTVERTKSPTIAIRLIVKAGSQDDPQGKEGLAALTAAMISEGGTKELTYQQVLERLYPMAASVSSACRKEISLFAGEVHRDNWDRYVELLTEMIVHPRFAPEDFERLRNEAIDAISKGLRGNNDEELGKQVLNQMLYPAHRYGKPDLGTIQGLKAITLDDVKAFHQSRYTLDALHLGVTGAIEDQDLAKLQTAFAGLPKSGEASKPAADAERSRSANPSQLDILIVKKPSAAATAISLGFPIDVNRSDDDFYALAVANSYLGEHRTFNGKLMQDLRGKRGLNYGDYSYIEDFIQDGGSTFPVPNNPRRQQAFSIWIRPVPHDKTGFALRAALWEFDRLVKNGIPPADFEATRDYLLNYSKLWVQTPSRRLGYEIDGKLYGRKDLITELAERLPKMKVEDVNNAIKRHLAGKQFRVAIVTNDAEKLSDLLTSGRPTPLVYDTAGTPEDVIAEDKVIQAFPLDKPRIRITPVETLFESMTWTAR